MPRQADRGTREAETLRAYLREIGKLPRLTPDEELALGRRIQAQRDEAALQQLVEGNLRFVVSYARRYRGFGVSFLDLVHEGNLGLIEAAKRFDPSRNVKFITYAVWWIRQAMLHALSGGTRAFSVPVKVSGAAARFGRQVAALATQLERTPTRREIADDLALSPADVEELLRIGSEDVSLNDRHGAEGGEFGDLLEQAVESPVERELMQQAFLAGVRRVLDELGPREREVLERRFGLGRHEPSTLQEIGDRLHLTRERVRQIELAAKQKLRHSKKLRELRTYLN
ncbi:MAG: RNA polymerase sigma factor RpoD/SigA [Acidobacteriota bacterium]|nr:RNA polymerase sigma factor RpoD/SigA [Acidobacteriota bacterium]